MVDARKVRSLLARIDDRRVHDFLRDGLEDLRRFGAAVYEAFPEL